MLLLALLLSAVSAGPTPHDAPQRHAFPPLAALARRDTTSAQLLLTCGFVDGDPARPRTAQPGYDCRVDTAHGLWAFCPTTVVQATDCGMAAACRDSGTCSSVCKMNDASGLTTFTCASSGTNIQYCSTAMLTFGVDQSYGYLACGNTPVTEHLLITATAALSTSSSSSSSSSSAPKSTASTAPKTTTASNTASTSSSTAAATPTTTPATTAPAAATPTTTTTTPTPPSTPVGAIVGGVLGGLALVCASAIAAVYILKRYNARGPGNATGPVAPDWSPDAYDTPLRMASVARPPHPPSLYEADAASSTKLGGAYNNSQTPMQQQQQQQPQQPYPGPPGYHHGYAVELPSQP